MASREITELDGSQPTAEVTSRTEAAFGRIITERATKFLAIVRVVVGLEFLWAFADKTFGLGYATPAARAWINGGSPTKGFLSRVAVGPFESTFHAIAGAAWADWLFMAGLLGIGIALLLGVGLRVAAVSGTLMMLGCGPRSGRWPRSPRPASPVCRPTRSSTTTSSTPWP
jgi:thiosulfate dehydrogenase [quinone] large subunit